MKYLLTSLVIVSMCSVAQAGKEQGKPGANASAVICKILNVKKGKDGKPNQVTVVKGSEFAIELMKVASNTYAGSTHIKQGPQKELAAYAEVKMHSEEKSSIKMRVNRLAAGKITQSGSANNFDDLTSPDLDVTLSASEVVACSLIEE